MARKRFFRGGKSVRESMWVSDPATNSTIAAGGTALLVSTANAALLALRPFTIVRSRGILAFRSDQTGASELFAAALGLAVVSEQAAAIGATAIPTPMTDLGSDLFYTHQLLAG